MPTATGHTTAIRASRVLGTDVYDAAGDKLGEVEDVVLDKTGERIMFAVVRVGGVLTSTDNYFPMPWAMLDYDEKREGYATRLTREKLTSAPAASSVSDLVEDDGGAAMGAIERYYSGAGG
jgi:sporulation protein YlmC with PRC-barrel domain